MASADHYSPPDTSPWPLGAAAGLFVLALGAGLAGFLVDVTGSFAASFLMIAMSAILGLVTIAILRAR